MANITSELKPLQVPGEVLAPESGSKYEEYRPDGVYAYDLLPNGRPNRDHVKITYNTGDVYDGSLKHGKQSEVGKYYWKDGGIYEGNFKKGILTGTGKYTAANGDVYEGNFKDDKYNGQGKYTWEDGSSFEGTFNDGRILNGKFTDANGSVYNCRFKYKRNGECKNSVMLLVRLAQPKVNHEEKKVEPKKAKVQKDGLLSKDKALIASIKKSKRGAEFKNLYSGAAGNNEKAEKGLIAILNFFSNSDAEQIGRIFKSSNIYDKTKGDEHVTDMISGVIKRSKDFTSSMKATTSTKQKYCSAKKGAAKGASR